jgi:serine/threonine protein kinase
VAGDDDQTRATSDDVTRASKSSEGVAAGPTHGSAPTPDGVVYADRYRLGRPLGQGGMAQVYQVRDTVTDTDFALKIIRDAPDEPDRVERFKREIGVLSKINHPAVPRIIEWGVHREQMFFVSELVDGRDLRAEIAERGAWPAADAAALAATVADALAAAHLAGIVHRDVKPSNIMIARDGSIRLLDFGIARPTGMDSTTLTKTGTIVGTPAYMSPEQFDSRWIDARSDVYSLGVVLFELLTGRPPFVSDTVIGVAMMHKNDQPRPPRSIRTDVPAWLDRLVLKCLEKAPEKRYATAATLAAELRKEHVDAKRRRLPSGDVIVEDDADADGWALVLASPKEKTGWALGMVLRFYDRLYKLQRIAAPADRNEWTYSFEQLAETEVIRRFVDYREDCAERLKPRKRGILTSLFRKT